MVIKSTIKTIKTNTVKQTRGGKKILGSGWGSGDYSFLEQYLENQKNNLLFSDWKENVMKKIKIGNKIDNKEEWVDLNEWWKMTEAQTRNEIPSKSIKSSDEQLNSSSDEDENDDYVSRSSSPVEEENLSDDESLDENDDFLDEGKYDKTGRFWVLKSEISEKKQEGTQQTENKDRDQQTSTFNKDEEQRTENREQRTENREQRTENREQRTENKNEQSPVRIIPEREKDCKTLQEWLDWKYPTKEDKEKVESFSFSGIHYKSLFLKTCEEHVYLCVNYLIENFPNLKGINFNENRIFYPHFFSFYFKIFYQIKKKSYLNNPKREFPFLSEINVHECNYKQFPLAKNDNFKKLAQEYYQVRDKENWLDISEMEDFYNDPDKLLKELKEVYKFFGGSKETHHSNLFPNKQFFTDEKKNYLNVYGFTLTSSFDSFTNRFLWLESNAFCNFLLSKLGKETKEKVKVEIKPYLERSKELAYKKFMCCGDCSREIYKAIKIIYQAIENS